MNSPCYPSLEYLRPRQILTLAHDPGLVLIPVSPAIEWHSYHLPLGTDAIIAEEVARHLAIRLRAAYFRVLPLGLDEVRDAQFKAAQGLPPHGRVFGMNYPNLPLASEYTTEPVFRALVESRLGVARAAGFRRAALLNHHGGHGQRPLLDRLAEAWTSDTFEVLSLDTLAGDDFRPPRGQEHSFSVGGHAGLAETMQLLAFRPDLVDVQALPEGALGAAEYGILHDAPEIPAAANPRRATAEAARAWGDHVLARLAGRLQAPASHCRKTAHTIR